MPKKQLSTTVRALAAALTCTLWAGWASAVTGTATLSAGNATFDSPSYSFSTPLTAGFSCDSYPISTAVAFTAVEFTVNATQEYNFTTTGGTVFDPYLVLYSAPFAPSSPFTNCIGADDDSGGGSNGLDSRIQTTLSTGVIYTAVIAPLVSGTYGTIDWSLVGTSGGLVTLINGVLVASTSAATSSGGTLSVTLSGSDTAKYVVVAQGAAAPTAAQVIAGVTYGGVPVVSAGSVVVASANTATTGTISGLAGGTAYDVYVVANNSGEGSVVRKTTLTTAAAPNNAPVASAVAITGTAQAGSQLNGGYTYSDTESNAQGTSTFRWVRNNVNTGVAGGTNVATTQNYTPVNADVGNFLYFCVTPVASAGTATGTEVCSVATAAVAAATVNGTCGSSANVASAFLPTANLCSAGAASAVTAGTSSWSWSCTGTGPGATNTSCSAPYTAVTGGGGTVGAVQTPGTNGWQINQAASGFVALPAPAPAGVTISGGATKVVLNTGASGTSTTVTLRFSSIPAGAQLYKYGKENGIGDTDKWFAYPATIDVAAGTVTYTLTDGQKGDNDWTANGVIDDPVGLGVGGAGVAGVPTLSEWAMALLAGLMGLATFVTLRRRTA